MAADAEMPIEVFRSDNDAMLAKICACDLTMEGLCDMVKEQLQESPPPQCANDRQFKKTWNADGDGSCFFACLFATFMHILLPDKNTQKGRTSSRT